MRDKELDLQKETENIGFSGLVIGKEEIIKRLKEKEYRMTKQRMYLLDLILESDMICCKEIHYKAHKNNSGLGIATIYRFLNVLEEVGAIRRKNPYQFCHEEDRKICDCVVEFNSGERQKVTKENFYRAVAEGMKQLGIAEAGEIQNITVMTPMYEE